MGDEWEGTEGHDQFLTGDLTDTSSSRSIIINHHDRILDEENDQLL